MNTRFLSLLVILALAVNIAGAQSNKARLIVRGDDMGFSHSGNLALIQCYRNGIQKTIEVIVPSPWFPEAVRMLNENPGVDVGIHLVLTSEWDNVKWRPMTAAASLRDQDGYFYPMLWPNPNYPANALLQNKWSIEDIETEWRAQIEMAIKKIPRLSHISGHMGCTNLTAEVTALAKKLAKEYKLDIDLASLNVKYVGYEGPRKTSAEKIDSFIKMLEKLQAGDTYIFIDHPGLADAELKAISHIGYEEVAADRQGVTDCWTSDKVKSRIKELGIVLISYKDLVQ